MGTFSPNGYVPAEVGGARGRATSAAVSTPSRSARQWHRPLNELNLKSQQKKNQRLTWMRRKGLSAGTVEENTIFIE